MKNKLSFAVICLLAALYVFIAFNRHKWEDDRFPEWDKHGYYMYLPSIFIYKDGGTFSYYPEINKQYHISGDNNTWALYYQPKTGRMLDKYAIGVAVMELPFFLAAHGLTLATGHYAANGYTDYYELSIFFAGWFWAIMGLAALRRLLLGYYDDRIAAFTILLLGLGTNLYSYTAFDYGMSHPISFGLFGILFLLTDSWYRSGGGRYLVGAGAVAGLIIITRPTNIVVLLLPLLWSAAGPVTLGERLRMFARSYGWLSAALLAGFAAVSIQLIAWKYYSGDWIHYSYEEEGFDFRNPHIWEGLFSYRKGWFVWTPIALLALCGFLTMRGGHRSRILPLLLPVALAVYIVFSWGQWWYGGGFGARPMIEYFALLSFPLAALIRWGTAGKHALVRAGTIGVLALLMVYHSFQTYQYSLGVYPWDQTNKNYYWRVFLKLEKTEEDWKLLEWD